jgi:CrcB protein
MIVTLTALSGGVGAVVRWLVTRRVSRSAAPWVATAIVNVAGAGALGILIGWGVEGRAAASAAGFLAGFTTFSTWIAEVAGVWPATPPGLESRALVVPLALGLAAGAVGLALGGRLA